MKEYFSHDFNARNDPKLQAVLMELGVAGIGLYWCLVEQLYEQGGRLPLASLGAIAFNLHTEQDVVERLIRDFGLFEYDEECFWSASVKKRNQRREEVRQSYVERGKIGAEKRWRENSLAIAQLSAQNSSAIAIKEKEKREDKKENIPIGDIKERKEEIAKSLSSDGADDSPVCPSVDESKREVIDSKRFIEFFNRVLAESGSIIPPIKSLSEQRMTTLYARSREYGKRALETVVRKAAVSDFLNGRNDRSFTANFDWMFKPANFAKILEGNFDNTTVHNNNHNNNGSNNNGRSRRGYFDVTAKGPEDYTEVKF